jgi:hypothetical protein
VVWWLLIGGLWFGGCRLQTETAKGVERVCREKSVSELSV